MLSSNSSIENHSENGGESDNSINKKDAFAANELKRHENKAKLIQGISEDKLVETKKSSGGDIAKNNKCQAKNNGNSGNIECNVKREGLPNARNVIDLRDLDTSYKSKVWKSAQDKKGKGEQKKGKGINMNGCSHVTEKTDNLATHNIHNISNSESCVSFNTNQLRTRDMSLNGPNWTYWQSINNTLHVIANNGSKTSREKKYIKYDDGYNQVSTAKVAPRAFNHRANLKEEYSFDDKFAKATNVKSVFDGQNKTGITNILKNNSLAPANVNYGFENKTVSNSIFFKTDGLNQRRPYDLPAKNKFASPAYMKSPDPKYVPMPCGFEIEQLYEIDNRERVAATG